MNTIKAAALVLLGTSLAFPAQAQAQASNIKMCIFDIAGRSGPAFAQARDITDCP